MKNITIKKANYFEAIKQITETDLSSIKGIRELTDKDEILETKIEALGFEMITEFVEFIEEVKDCKYNFKGGFTAVYENGSKHYNNDIELLIDQQKEMFEHYFSQILKLGTALIKNNLND